MKVDASTKYPAELMESMEALSRLVLRDEDVTSTLQRITELAVHAIDGAEICSVTLARKDKIETVAATADLARRVDDIQYETKEGPCLSSVEEQATFHIPNMGKDETWPIFSRRAAEETGIISMLSFVLKVHEDSLGALNLMATKTDAFTEEDVATGTVFAVQAGIALANAVVHAEDQKQITELNEGIKTRQVIGQAVGLIMATRQVNPDDAFEILKTASQGANIKIRDIAERIVEKSSEL